MWEDFQHFPNDFFKPSPRMKLNQQFWDFLWHQRLGQDVAHRGRTPDPVHKHITHPFLGKRQGLRAGSAVISHVRPGTLYLVSGVFSDGNLRLLLRAAELQDLSLFLGTQGTDISFE